VPALDGLRGVAILLVVARHYFVFPGGGGYGVNLFFVLSGFLITTLLLEEHAERGSIDLRGFYVRRARRLAPALIVMLGVYLALAGLQLDPYESFHRAVENVAVYGFYTANVVAAYFPHLVNHPAIGPLWSLAEEEQFYLLWPLALVLLLRRGIPSRLIERGLLVLIAAIAIERMALIIAGFAYDRVAYSPESSADGLLAGVLLAIFLGKPRAFSRGDVIACALVFALPVMLAMQQHVGATLAAFGSAGLIGAVVTDPSRRAARILSWPPLVWVGVISYSLYLWHVPILDVCHHRRVVALPLAFVVAWLSYRFVEQPFRQRRLRAIEGAAVPVRVA
jgi:peptidoglycan/LPS O-acetylase OafA/YrhL